jgi:hypothetical protein
VERDEVIKMFNDLISGERREIEFSKGYIVFEETYRAFAERFKLKRREFGYLVVITYDR